MLAVTEQLQPSNNTYFETRLLKTPVTINSELKNGNEKKKSSLRDTIIVIFLTFLSLFFGQTLLHLFLSSLLLVHELLLDYQEDDNEIFKTRMSQNQILFLIDAREKLKKRLEVKIHFVR